MKRRGIAITSAVVLVLLLGFSILLGTRHPATDASSLPSPLLGQTAPAVTGVTLDGHHFSWDSEKGRVVVVTFWASWCAPCQQEAPELSTFAWHHRADGVDVVGVLFNDAVAAGRQFETTYGSLYPTVIDTAGAIANNYGVVSPPTTFVVDRHGVVAAALVGPTTAAQLSRVVARVEAS